MGARLATHIWVSAYLQKLSSEAISVYVQHKGEPEAGAVMIKLSTTIGHAQIYRRLWDPISDARRWEGGDTDLETNIDAAISREVARDPDLWIIEVEDPRGRHFLDAPGIAG